MVMRRLLACTLVLAFALAAAAQEASPRDLYNAACHLALDGKKDEAFAKLSEAIASGWANVEHMQRDPDLVSLRDDPRWQPLVEAAKERIAADRKRWSDTSLVTPYTENLSDELKLAGLARVWSEVHYNFANFDLVPDVDWDALYVATIPRVLATKSTFDYYNELIAFVAKLRDGHTNVWQPAPLLDRVWGMPPIRQRMVDGRIMITRVADGVEGVTRGDEIVEIDGRPWREFAKAHVIPYLSASTPHDLDERTGDRLLTGAAGTPVTLKLRDAKGNVSTVRLERLPRAQRLPSIDAPFEYRRLPGNVAYIALNDFGTNAAAEAYDKHFDEIATADAMIIDLRNNGGGSTSVGYHVISTLIDKTTPTTRAQKITYRPTDRARSTPQRFEYEESSIAPDRNGRHFRKPVAVLIGPGTYSAAEDFSVAWKMLGRGPIIGRATGGSTGQPLSLQLPGGGGMRICTKRDRFADGREFVGVGIQPDIEVRTRFEDAQAGRDPVLERALAEVKR